MRLLDTYLKEVEREMTASKKGKVQALEVGEIVEIKDGVAILTGLEGATYGELVEFVGGTQGFIIDLLEDTVGVVVLGDYTHLRAGDTVRATRRELSIPVGEELIGRVVDPLAVPLDKGARLKSKESYPIEKVAPGVVDRTPVSVPLQTGIKAIDGLVPIGRGQRELIIGDRSTGKTTLCIDTILNQKGQDVICIYAAMGQKNSKVAAVVELLKKHNALDYTVVVSASASDSPAMHSALPWGSLPLVMKPLSYLHQFLPRPKTIYDSHPPLRTHPTYLL